MNSNKITFASVTVLLLLATGTIEASHSFGPSPAITIVDTFRAAHPVLMGLFNIGGIFLLIGVCASFYSLLFKNSAGK